MDIESIAFNIIAHSGACRTLAFEALNAAKKGDIEKAYELLEESHKESVEAHNVQTELLVAEANGDQTPLSILLVHAQDHFMTSTLAQELVKGMIDLLEERKKD